MWQLIINGPGYFDTAYDLPEGVVHLGRADENDIVLSGDLVSRKHVRLTVSPAKVEAKDLNSRNGSRINETPLKGSQVLELGDVLRVGENTLALRRAAPAEAAATEMIDLGAGGSVKRFGRGQDVGSVLVARDVRHSVVMELLGNVGSLSPSQLPFATAGEEPQGPRSGEHLVPADAEGNPIAWQSLVLLFKVAEALANAPTLTAFLETTCAQVMARVGAATGVVLLRHHAGVMVPAAVKHSRTLQRGEVPVSDAVVNAALAKGQALAVADVRDDARFNDRESVVLYGVDQVLCVPIGKKAPFTGALYLNREGVSKEPIEQLLDVCTAVAQLIDSGVQKFETKSPAVADDRARRSLERFVGPITVERQVQALKAEGGELTGLEEKTITVLAVELVGLAALAGKLAPEKLHSLLSDFSQRATSLLFSFDATLHHLSGDRLVAVFGAPFGKGDDALRTVRAAMALKAEWKKAAAKRAPKERVELRAGISTGKALLGLVGGEVRVDHVVLGEVVHVAEWLAGQGLPDQVLLTSKTLAAIGARFDVTPLGERPLPDGKGKLGVFLVLEEDAASGTLSGVK